jgi:hypothetical protein
MIRWQSEDQHATWFLFSTLTLLTACMLVLRSALLARSPELAYFGVTFDLCVSVPALYYAFLVRPRSASPLRIVPVFVLMVLLARAVVPAPHRGFLDQLWMLQFPLEAGVAGMLILRTRDAVRKHASEHDVVAKVEGISREVLGDTRLAKVVSSEIAALYLGFAGWRHAPARPAGAVTSTFHQRVGWGSIAACLIVLIAAEAIAIHLLVQQWSHRLAWVITALDVWGAVWLVGDYQAFRIRPMVINERGVDLRFGFRWSLTVPYSAVAAVEELPLERAERLRRDRSYLRLSILEEPDQIIVLREPIAAAGVAGMSRAVTSIGLRVDDPAAIQALKERTAQGAVVNPCPRRPGSCPLEDPSPGQ